MSSKFLKKIRLLYKKSDQLLASGQFGAGLWPVGIESGQFMSWLIRFFSLKSGLEVGAGVGYSTSWFTAAFLESGGELISLEYFLPKVLQMEKHIRSIYGVQFAKIVHIIPSSFGVWLDTNPRKKFDFVFFDQRKVDYLPHLKRLIPFLKKGAFICSDNVISHRRECKDFLQFLRYDYRFESITLPLSKGMEMSRYMR